MPDEPESHGLLALMLFQHARGDTRMQDDGSIVLLEKQDRSRWDRDLIAEGSLALERARRSRAPGSYTLQAEIAGQHSLAPTSADTDWSEIERLYRSLLALHSTPVVALNHAVAVLMAEGPERALPLLDSLAQPLSGYVYFHSTRGEVLRRLARETEARKAFQQALNLTLNESERAFLAAKLEE